MKTLKLILSIPVFIMGFIFVWMSVQAGFEVLPQVSSFWECVRTLAGMAALLFYGGLCNWLGYKIYDFNKNNKHEEEDDENLGR